MKGIGTVAFAVAGLLVAGCSSGGETRTDSLMDRVDGLEASSTAAVTSVDKATSAMNALVDGAGADPLPLLERYRTEVAAAESAKAAVESAGASLRAGIEDHFAAWEQDAATIQNPEIKAAAMARRDEARRRMGSLHPALEGAKGGYDAYVKDLRDIETLLAADLSPGGVQAAQGTVQKATEEAVRTKKALNRLVEVCGEVREALGIRRAE